MYLQNKSNGVQRYFEKHKCICLKKKKKKKSDDALQR